MKWLEESLEFAKNQHVILRQAEITVPVNLQHLIEFKSITLSSTDNDWIKFHFVGHDCL